MKKVLFVLVIIAVLISCNKPGYTFEGNLTGIAGKGRAILTNLSNNKEDSAIMINGQFKFTGNLKRPKAFRLTLTDAEKPPFGILKSSIVYIENGKQVCEGTFASLESFYDFSDTLSNRPTITGSKSNDLYNQYLNSVRPYVNQSSKISIDLIYDTIQAEERSEDKEMQVIEHQSKLVQLEKKRDEIKNKFILEHASSQVAYDLAFASMVMKRAYAEIIDESRAKAAVYYESIAIPGREQADSWISALSASGSFSQQQIDTLTSLSNICAEISEGASFIDGKLYKKDGSSTKLSQVLSEGNYTLIDFWASWCGSCREAIPHLKKLQSKYKSKGLNVISISCDDSEALKKAWLKAMSVEKMPWPQYRVDAKDNISYKYYVYSIPNIILLDPENNIVKVGVRGTDLDYLLYNIYGF